MKLNVKLTKLSDNPNALRTNEVVGTTPRKPVVGQPFELIADSLTPGGLFRSVITSPVASMEVTGNVTVIKTANSTYQLEFSE